MASTMTRQEITAMTEAKGESKLPDEFVEGSEVPLQVL